MDGILVLEDGAYFRGRRFGSTSNSGGEVIFNTSLTGYQEILSDPSYAGQIVVLTCPHIGNYGVNALDVESGRVRVQGLIVRDHHPVPSNWRSDRPLDAWLAEVGAPGLCGVDTRALVLHLRDRGALRGVVRDLEDDALPVAGRVSGEGAVDAPAIAAMAREAAALPSMEGRDLASEVSTGEPWSHGTPEADLSGPSGTRPSGPSACGQRRPSAPAPGFHVVALDFGIKRNIVRQLVDSGCRVTVVPATTGADAVLALRPDGVLLSNGPGDPEPLAGAVATIAALLGRVPIFGICLGHQLLGLACGGRTFKLRFGHHGSNHPVRHIESGRIEITAQNHGFAIDPGSLDGREVTLTHLHLNDDTVAGLRHKRFPACSVQYHPEASPGPHDSHYLFAEFVDAMARFAAGEGRGR